MLKKKKNKLNKSYFIIAQKSRGKVQHSIKYLIVGRYPTSTFIL